MKNQNKKSLLLIACLIALTCVALANAKRSNNQEEVINDQQTGQAAATDAAITVNAKLTRNKIHLGADGQVAMALTLTAKEMAVPDQKKIRNVDMVIVLDRSGSMSGAKINDAKEAINGLIASLSAKDRFALVSYANDVTGHTGLIQANQNNRNIFKNAVQQISAGGGTNLGGGLEQGMEILRKAPSTGNLGRVILISDGLANHGITDPLTLGKMASTAVVGEFVVSTVGVGLDFNEHLMTTIADQGTGNYYFMENPASFAGVFAKEFQHTRMAAATSIEIKVPLNDGIALVDAAGYPIEVHGSMAIFRPGNLLYGQSRKLYLTLQIPANQERSFDLNGIEVAYRYQGEPSLLTLNSPMVVTCVQDKQEAYASIDAKEWENKVVQQDMNRLREQVSKDIKEGRRGEALGKIQQYKADKEEVNAVVDSGAVAQSLEDEVEELNEMVNDTFSGAPAAVAAKQKKASKSLQYEGLKAMRSIE